jgi:nicotinamide phosphoribosyltransferase
MSINPITQTDGYKVDHRSQYPKGTELVFSNFTPRSTKYATKSEHCDDKVVVFGLQYFIKWYLIEEFNKGFFNQPKEIVVEKYKRRIEGYLGPGAITYEHIGALHDLGFVPVSIRSLLEGSVVDERVPTLVIENTIPEFFWVTNFLESVMSCMLWKPSTSATTARKYRKILDHFCELTGGDPDFVQFQGHDFSFRGMSGIQDAQMSGAGHLLSFAGTDTIPAIDFLEEYYGADCEKELIGCSVPATEHSVMCMGTKESEIDTFKRLITEVYPSGIVSIVSDTWDFWKVLTEYLPELKDDILSRSGGPLGNKVVIRPDSGDPVEIICGMEIEEIKCTEDQFHDWAKETLHELLVDQTPHGEDGGDIKRIFKNNDKYWECHYAPDWNRHDKQYYYIDEYGDQMTKREVSLSPEDKGAIECLWDVFGGTVNGKGFKVLDPHIGLIYGDSITIDRCEQICQRLANKGFASTNVVFGIGSFTYEYVTRDTLGYAMKATAGVVSGEAREIFKDPKTDDGLKKSAKGLLAVHKMEDGEFVLKDQVSRYSMENCDLVEIFRDGELIIDQTMSEIKARLNA